MRNKRNMLGRSKGITDNFTLSQFGRIKGVGIFSGVDKTFY